jgi:hypothetical protein
MLSLNVLSEVRIALSCVRRIQPLPSRDHQGNGLQPAREFSSRYYVLCMRICKQFYGFIDIGGDSFIL